MYIFHDIEMHFSSCKPNIRHKKFPQWAVLVNVSLEEGAM